MFLLITRWILCLFSLKLTSERVVLSEEIRSNPEKNELFRSPDFSNYEEQYESLKTDAVIGNTSYTVASESVSVL